MLKSLFAAACVTLCCMGNDYPAKAAPARTGELTPYQEVRAAVAVGLCWIENGIDKKTNIYEYMHRTLAKRGIYSDQIKRITKLPHFAKSVTDFIDEGGGCARFLPDRQKKPVVRPTHSI